MRTIHRNNYDPRLGDYHERIIIDDAREKRWLFDCDGVYNDITQVQVADELGESPTHAISQRAATEAINDLDEGLATETAEREAADEELGDAIDDEALARAEADAAIEQEIQDIKDNPDVVDIVATYADLQAYDTSELGDKDVIRVLADETHQGESSYYRWSTDTSTWTFIGATGPYYTKDETNALLDEKQDTLTAGENIAIDNDTISADVGTTFYVDSDEFTFLPLNTSTSISIYKDKELTTLATEAEVYEALYSDKVVKLAESDGDPDGTIRTYLVSASDDDFRDGRRIWFHVIIGTWYREPYYDRVEFTWEPSATRPNATKRVGKVVRVVEVQGGTYNIDNQSSSGSGIYELRNTGNADTLLLPKGIDGNSNFQLRIKPSHSVYIMEMAQTNAGGRKYLVFGATDGTNVKVALVEPNATSKLKLWTQYTDNLTTTSTDGQKVLSAHQGKVLADRIGDLSTLQTTAKTNTVAAINEVFGYKGLAKKLTPADYNWNSVNQSTTGTLDCVALWLLEPGMYYKDTSSTKVYAYNTQPMGLNFFVVANFNTSEAHIYCIIGPTKSQPNHVYNGSSFTVRKSDGAKLIEGRIDDIYDALDSNSEYFALSAKQGKILNDRIGNLSTLQTTAKTSTVAAINELVAGGGGGAATINSTDWSSLWQ